MTRQLRAWLISAFLLAAVACQPEAADQAPAGDATAQVGSATTDSMMGGMAGMEMGTEMMAQMRSMEMMHGDSLMQMVPQHRQMLGNMMAQMDREMQATNMGADSQWSALADSLRNDLTRMPQMSAAEMEQFMAGHRGRVTRLMEMHRSMMGR